jgi:HK97 family phage major capsid protein
MNWREKKERAASLIADIRAIHENTERSAEDNEKAEVMLGEVKKLTLEIQEAQRLEAAAAELEAVDAKASAGGEFKSPGEFYAGVFDAYINRKQDPRLRYMQEDSKGGHEIKQMVENVGASGGFLVPPEFLANLQAVQAENAIVRPRATIIRMRRRQVDIPVLDQTGTTASQPHWFGGMLAYWGEEAAEKDLTTAKFRKVSLVAHKLIMYTRASDELLSDAAVSLEDFLAGPMGFAGAIQWYEDYAFINGTGAGQPLGVINAGATITVARTAAVPPFQYVDASAMMQSFLPSGRGVWIISQSLMSYVIEMNGPAGNPSYVWQPNARDGIPGYLLGFPVIWSEKVPLTGMTVNGDVILADWRYYLIGDRQATTVESTKYDKWAYDQTSWRAVHRVDGQPWLSAPLTYQDGTSQVSPFVILGAKST